MKSHENLFETTFGLFVLVMGYMERLVLLHHSYCMCCSMTIMCITASVIVLNISLSHIHTHSLSLSPVVTGNGCVV